MMNHTVPPPTAVPTFHDLRRIVRNVAADVALRALWPALRRRSLARLLLELTSPDGLRWAIAVAGLSLYRSLSRGLGPAACGLICGLPIAALHSETRTEVCMYLLVRCLHGALANSDWVPAPLAAFPHYDTLSMSLSAMWLLYGYVFFPSTIAPSYKAFLTSASRVDWRATMGISKLYAEGHYGSAEAVTLCWSRGIPPPTGSDPKHVCQTLLHPGVTCTRHVLGYIPRHIRDIGVPMYLPLKVSSAVFFSHRALVTRPAKTVWKVVKSTLRSAVFLGFYCAVPIVGACFFSNFVGRRHFLLVGTALTFNAGLMTVIEPRGRRLDLALFCAMHAMRSFLGVMVVKGLLPRASRLRITLLFCACLAYTFRLVKDGKAHATVASAVQAL